MTRVLGSLGSSVDADTRRRLRERVATLMRGLEFLDQKQSQQMIQVRQRGWTNERLEVVCELVAFYQIVVGPLASAARGRGPSGLGTKTAISYGSDMLFDREFSRASRVMEGDFKRMTFRVGVMKWWLVANDASDLAFRMSSNDGDEV
jgi:hypothetical protein